MMIIFPFVIELVTYVFLRNLESFVFERKHCGNKNFVNTWRIIKSGVFKKDILEIFSKFWLF